jgi:transcriptional regulator with GAF, ATPase, and Fis domain
VDVRVVAATHRDLAAAVDGQSFRGDLLARLTGWTLRVPPLRARRQDILALGERWLRKAGASAGFTADAAEALLLHPWRYNVRELEQVLTAASLRAAGAPLRREHLPSELGARLLHRVFKDAKAAEGPAPIEVQVPRDRAPTREELCRILEHTGGNMAEVADYFGKDRRQVYRWAERLGVDPESFRKPGVTPLEH